MQRQPVVRLLATLLAHADGVSAGIHVYNRESNQRRGWPGQTQLRQIGRNEPRPFFVDFLRGKTFMLSQAVCESHLAKDERHMDEGLQRIANSAHIALRPRSGLLRPNAVK